MIDPTNTEPIPVHKPHIRRVLSLLAIFALALVAITIMMSQIDLFSEQEPVGGEVVPLPVSTERTEFTVIQEKVNSGEITREEAEKETQALFERIPTPVPPTN